jgi:methylated-DNA-[protein]-cysteine S-methyltransferase
MKKREIAQSFYFLRETPFGPVAVLWSVYGGEPKICRVLLPKPGASVNHLVRASFTDFISSSCNEIDVVADQIVAFLNGDDIHFPLHIVRLDLCSKFRQMVLRAEHGIPRGYVSTYQRIAKYVGKPSAARAGGTALASNPFPIIIPCHRAIRSDGTLGGFQGGLTMKRALLEMEGIPFTDFGRVATEDLFY